MRGIIAAGLAELGLADRVPTEAPEQLAEYGLLLLEKNQVMNLTAIREPDQVARLHMLDCAALAALTDLEGKTLIDVGTGAGFPGLPLKILVPSLEVTLLDSLNKRVDWLNEVISALGLTGVRTIHARAEEQALVPGFRDSFDLACARAVADLRLLCELCLPYVKPRGRGGVGRACGRPGGGLRAMKSTGSGQELEEAGRAIRTLGGAVAAVENYPVPGAGVTHRLIQIEKRAPTPKGFPRRWAKAQKAPL